MQGPAIGQRENRCSPYEPITLSFTVLVAVAHVSHSQVLAAVRIWHGDDRIVSPPRTPVIVLREQHEIAVVMRHRSAACRTRSSPERPPAPLHSRRDGVTRDTTDARRVVRSRECNTGCPRPRHHRVVDRIPSTR